MVAVARGLMAKPRLLLLDEPSLGLAPVIVQAVFQIIGEIHQRGTTVLLVEQNAHMALKVANWGYVLESGPARARRRSRDAVERRTHPRRLSRRRTSEGFEMTIHIAADALDRLLRRGVRARRQPPGRGAPRRRLARRRQSDRPRQPRRDPHAALCRLGALGRHRPQSDDRASRRYAGHRRPRRPLRLRSDGRATGRRHWRRESEGGGALRRSRCATPAMSAASANGRSARRRRA